MKKVMFNDQYDLTEAVLAGYKTMTRRAVKMNDAYERLDREYWSAEDIRNWNNSFTSRILNAKREEREKCFEYLLSHTKYKVWEVVAVAQSYKDAGINLDYIVAYKKDGTPVTAIQSPGWTNKMFVRADLMPHQIRIIGIKCERLQDISEEDCMKEGVYRDYGDTEFPPHEFYDYDGNKDNGFNTPREAFASLIDKVSGKGTWKRNPWVIAYEFELVKPRYSM